MEFMLQLLIAGLSLGSVYALIAHAFNVTIRAVNVVNFAHPGLMMISAMSAIALYRWGLPLWSAMTLAAAGTVLLGVLVERVAIRPVINLPTSMGWLVSTLGFLLILQAVASILWSARPMAFPTYLFSSTDYITIGEFRISLQYALIFFTSIIVMAILEIFMEHTLLGKAFKATAYDSQLAQLVGINAKNMIVLAFAVSSLLGVVAAYLVTPITGVSPAFGLLIMLKGFVAMVLGGIGQSKGALLGGLIVGVLEQFSNGYVGSSVGELILFTLMIFMLVVLPHGVFGKKRVVRV